MRNSAQPHGDSAEKPSVKERARDELRRYTVVVIYLWVCIGAIMLYKKALLREEGVSFLAQGVAFVKALILGKFILIGEALGVGSRRSRSTLLHAIARRTVALFAFLVVLDLLEELLVGWFHGHPAAQTLTEFFGPRSLETLASCAILLLVILPLVVGETINQALGPGVLKKMLFSAPGPTAARHETNGTARDS